MDGSICEEGTARLPHVSSMLSVKVTASDFKEDNFISIEKKAPKQASCKSQQLPFELGQPCSRMAKRKEGLCFRDRVRRPGL